jgi:hypothetical protein
MVEKQKKKYLGKRKINKKKDFFFKALAIIRGMCDGCFQIP